MYGGCNDFYLRVSKLYTCYGNVAGWLGGWLAGCLAVTLTLRSFLMFD